MEKIIKYAQWEGFDGILNRPKTLPWRYQFIYYYFLMGHHNTRIITFQNKNKQTKEFRYILLYVQIT